MSKYPHENKQEFIEAVKQHLVNVAKTLALSFSRQIKGGNENSQYNGELEYDSLLLGGKGQIKIEIGIREPVLERKNLLAKTLVKDAFSQEPLVQDFEILGLSKDEAYAEKLRAAMSRIHPAIRDIFDVEYAQSKKLIDVGKIKSYVKQKFEIQNRIAKLSEERKQILKEQLIPHLRPVLRADDYEKFDFEKAWKNLIKLSEQLFDDN